MLEREAIDNEILHMKILEREAIDLLRFAMPPSVH